MTFNKKYIYILTISLSIGVIFGYHTKNSLALLGFHTEKQIKEKLGDKKYKLFVIADPLEVDIKQFERKFRIYKNVYFTNVGFIMYSGVGKLKTAHNLTKFLSHYKDNVSAVFNLGTAGATKNNKFSDMIECNKFIQTDWRTHRPDVQVTIKKKNVYLKQNNDYICSSQDTFVFDDKKPQKIVFEMEAYANAEVLNEFEMLDKFYAIKFVSDIVGSKDGYHWVKDAQKLNTKIVEKMKEIAIA